MAIGTSTTHTVAGFSADGADAMLKPSRKPVIEAAFPRESYRPGAVARLVIFSRKARNVSVQVFHAGTEDQPMKPRDEMYGTAVTDAKNLGTVRRAQGIGASIPNSPSGVYFAKLTGAGHRVGYAPFVLRPRRLGENRVAVVLPTLAWHAYNFHDDNHDGRADTWYASPNVNPVLLGRPFDQQRVPPNYKYYEQPFLRWLIANDKGSITCPVGRGRGEWTQTCRFLQPAHVLRPSRIRDRPRVRRGRRLPQSRREPDVSLGEQLLLANRHQPQSHDPGRQVARRRASPRQP